MSSVGVLVAAWRVVDDLEILLCLCRAYFRAAPRPSRRRVLRALLRTLSDRGLGMSLDTPESPSTKSDDESPPTDIVVESEVPRHARVRRVLDEIAIFGCWHAVARAVCGPAPRSRLALGAWLGSRLLASGTLDPPLPWPFALAFRAVLAHPLEKLAVRLVAPTGDVDSAWAGWRGAVLAALVDHHTGHLGLAAAPRLRALARLKVSAFDVIVYAKASLRSFPIAVAYVAVARLAAYLFFGARRSPHLDQVADQLLQPQPRSTLRRRRGHHWYADRQRRRPSADEDPLRPRLSATD